MKSSEILRSEADVLENGRLSVTPRSFEMRFLQTQLVGDVVPDGGSCRDLHSAIESGHGFVVLTEIQKWLTESDLGIGILGQDGGSALQFWESLLVSVPFSLYSRTLQPLSFDHV
jgi:hypothetical protein